MPSFISGKLNHLVMSLEVNLISKQQHLQTLTAESWWDSMSLDRKMGKFLNSYINCLFIF